MTIQLTVYKWLHTIDYIHNQMTIYNWLYTLSNDYTIDYIHSQITIQLTIYIAKWLHNWLYT